VRGGAVTPYTGGDGQLRHRLGAGTPPPRSDYDSGTNIVTWTFDDGNGNVSTATQRVIINSLTSRILLAHRWHWAVVAAQNQIVETINSGSKNPIKFDIKCGNNLITTGTPPTVSIQNWTGCPPPATHPI